MIDAIAVVQLGAAARARLRATRSRRPRSTSQRYAGNPQSCPVSEKASGGAPTDASRRNSCCRDQTSALSPLTMNGKVAEDADVARLARLRATGSAASHCRYAWNRISVASSSRAAASASGLAIAERRVPLAASARPLGPRVQRAEERVVVEPPALALDERLEAGARGWCRASTRARGTGRTPARNATSLTVADGRVVDRRRRRAPSSSSARSAAAAAPRRRARRRRAPPPAR